MQLPVFQLEDYLSRWEFKAPYLLCCSDAESFSMNELLSYADQVSLNLWNNLRLSYTEAPGLPILREEIGKLYSGLSESNILCFAGAEEGIFCALQTLIKSNDHVITFTPCYQSLESLPQNLGAQVTAISLKEENHWQIDLEEVKKVIQNNTKAIIINFPHNPTGAVCKEDTLKGLIDLARSQGIYIFSDEVYRLLGNVSIQPAPIATLYEKGLSLGVMSKAFGLAGLRVGWIACQDIQLLKKIEQTKYYTSICNSAPSEILSLIALRAKDTILQRNNLIVKNNLSLIDQFLERYSSLFSWVRPEGGCVGFMKFYSNISIDELARKLVEKEGVLLMPASIYNYQTNHFRIGFGRQNMAEALDKFEHFLKG